MNLPIREFLFEGFQQGQETRSGGAWTQQGTKLFGSGASASAQQGASVSLSADGNTALVGGRNDFSGYGEDGAAWVWTRSGGVWTQKGTKLFGSGASGAANQGQSVSLSGDGNTAIVGGPSDNYSGAAAIGAAWVFAAAVTTTYTAPSATGTGNITAAFTGGGGGCQFTKATFIPLTGGPSSPPAGSAPAGVTFPQGLFDFTASGCAPAGATLAFTVVYPQPLPPGAVYWKYGPTAATPAPHWYQLPAVIVGNTVTFSITDGGLGDDDLAANGTVVDQGGPGAPAGASFYPLTPCRIGDTRNSNGPLGGPALQPNATRSFDVAGVCGIPAGAVAISANLTVTNVGAPGELVVFPSDILRPNTSSISFPASRTRANNEVVFLSNSSTTFSVFNNSAATVDFIVDVNGFFR